MEDLPKLVAYFKDCYEADNKELNLWDVFHAKVEHRYFVPKEEELLTGHLPILPLPDAVGKEMLATLTLYEREKELYHTSFLLLAKGFKTGLKGDTIIAPLLLHPAKLEQLEDDFFVRPDFAQRYLNTQAIRLIQNALDLPITDHFADLQKAIPQEYWELGEAAKLQRLINQWIPAANTETLLHYPELHSERQVKQLYRALNVGEVMVVPASVVGIIPKGENTRSILNDLADLAASNTYSTALQALFYPERQVVPEALAPMETGHLPVILSAAQQQVIIAANKYPISQITGPPGTGKSFTIAALAAELASKGQKVLIASRTDAAVDVILDKIEADLNLNGIAMRGGKPGYNRKIAGRVTKLLHGINKASFNLETSRQAKRKLGNRLDDINQQLDAIDAVFAEKVNNELEWGAYLVQNEGQKGFGKKVKQAYIALRNKWQDSMGSSISRLHLNLGYRLGVAKEYLQVCFDLQMAELMDRNREEFAMFLQALRVSNATAKEKQLEELDNEILLKAFPIWLVTVSDMRRVLPMKTEIFDVAIIDEATQCDTASFLPILQRAKRVVIAGDPKQLRHMSFLAYSRQQALMEKHGLGQRWQQVCNYRDMSLLDVVSAALRRSEQVSFLSEHYRSRPAIIRFSNQEFYDNQLHVMTEHPGHEQVQALFVYATEGKRDTDGCNTLEAEAIINQLGLLVGVGNHQEQVATSIGVLSPFRKQADLLAKRVAERFDSETIARHRIMTGTAYSFQGAERDVMFVSLVVDDNAHHSALLHVSKDDVFNVSITRARHQLHLYSSVSPRALPAGHLLRRYLEHVDRPMVLAEAQSKGFDRFQNEVAKFLAEQFPEAIVHKGFTVAGTVLDLVIICQGRVYGIDLIGYPGDYQDAFPLERYRMFSRTGIMLYPLAYSHWKFQPVECQQELLAFLEDKR